MVEGLGFRLQSLEFRVQGSGFMAWGLAGPSFSRHRRCLGPPIFVLLRVVGVLEGRAFGVQTVWLSRLESIGSSQGISGIRHFRIVSRS